MILNKASLVEEFLSIGNPARYVASLGKTPYDWQERVLEPGNKRVCLLAPRQSGKSLIVSGLAVHKAKTKPGSLTIILAPKLQQAAETARKVKDFIAEDLTLEVIRSNDTFIELKNGSRILCLAATENAPRGFSGPDLIIIDEASRVPDEVYAATRPQLVTNPNATLIILSTPFGKQGFFWRAWAEETYWRKIRVEVPFELRRTDEGLTVSLRELEERAFQELWAKKGVEAFFSPHHTQEFLQEELDTVGEWWWKQEYGVEFVESKENLFDYEDIMAALKSDSEALLQNTEDEFSASSEAMIF